MLQEPTSAVLSCLAQHTFEELSQAHHGSLRSSNSAAAVHPRGGLHATASSAAEQQVRGFLLLPVDTHGMLLASHRDSSKGARVQQDLDKLV